MAWNPYTDRQNRGYSNILTSLFSEQTKTLPRILVWSIIFLLDLFLGAAVAMHLGLFQADAMHPSIQKLATILLIAAVAGIFWLQGFIWYSIEKAIRKRKDSE